MAQQRDGDEVEIEWTGLARTTLRPTSVGVVRDLGRVTALMYALAGLTAFPLAFGWIHVTGIHRAGFLVIGAYSVGTAAALAVLVARTTPETVRRWTPLACAVPALSIVPLLSCAVVLAGPNLTILALYYVEAPLVIYVMLQRRWSLVFTLYQAVGYTVALLLVDGVDSRFAHWLLVTTGAIGTGAVVGALAVRLEDARRSERAARAALALANDALEDLNHNLEARVEQQVDELERTGRLRRFLAPQVADVVMSASADDALLAPHRRDVAVLFCDLRGFTRFTNSVYPDTVVSVLGEYYAVVGAVLEAHGATIGGYDGDGIMAYLGDPIPQADAAAAGVAMARAIGRAVDPLVAGWRSAGHDLGYGIGAAYGPATLGVVGFDGRFDYTALGAVVNLAARLCSEATAGEIVIDGSMRAAAGGDAGARHRGDVSLKGFDRDIPTYALLR
jgi:adenylate cyclase